MPTQTSVPVSISSMPSYKTPPLVEVACGLRFTPIPEFRLTHIGLLWTRFREAFPFVQHAGPIVTEPGLLLTDEASGLPLPRVWFVDKSDSQLIQFQADRIYFNWRQRGDAYPRYSNVVGNFERAYADFLKFAMDENLGEISPQECELTYINNIAKGQGWDEVQDISGVFSDFIWTPRPERFLSPPAMLKWQAGFLLPENMGRLTAKLSLAKRTEDNLPVIVLELSARGIGKDVTLGGLRLWFDIAHEWIVRGFTDLTTSEAQTKYWHRER